MCNAPKRDAYMLPISTNHAKWEFTCREKPWTSTRLSQRILGFMGPNENWKRLAMAVVTQMSQETI
jgi:hypothetical protein